MRRGCLTALAGCCAGLGWSVAQAACEPLTLQILPSTTPCAPDHFMTGACAGFCLPDTSPLYAERLGTQAVAQALTAWKRPGRAMPDLQRTTAPVRSAHRATGLVVTAPHLRRGVPHTLQIAYAALPRKTRLDVEIRLLAHPDRAPIQKRLTLPRQRGSATRELIFIPEASGTHILTLLPEEEGEPPCFSRLSLRPGDAVGIWDSAALDALRMMTLPGLRWPVVANAPFFNWYDTVGDPTARDARRMGFGTVEAATLAQLINTPLIIQVPVFIADELPDRARNGLPITAAQLAADWVAYCNAAPHHPLARLRERHGLQVPLNVRHWELFPVGSLVQHTNAYAMAAKHVAAAMQAEDASIAVTRRASAVRTLPVTGPYVSSLLTRLAGAPAQETALFQPWYTALGHACTLLDKERAHHGDQVLHLNDLTQSGWTPSQQVSGAGWLLTLLNRHPVTRALAVTPLSAPEYRRELHIAAGWCQQLPGIQILVCNPVSAPIGLRIDLRMLKRRFMFYRLDQAAAEITAVNRCETLPIRRLQRSGVAMNQSVGCVIAPAAFARILVTE